MASSSLIELDRKELRRVIITDNRVITASQGLLVRSLVLDLTNLVQKMFVELLKKLL